MGMTTQNPTTLAKRRYVVRLIVSMAAYTVVLSATIAWLTHGAPTGLRIPIALLPVIPIAFVWYFIFRYLGETDEFERMAAFQAMAMAGGVTALAAVTYGFLESVGFPHLSAWWTWGVYMASWGLCRAVVARWYQ